MEKLSKVEYVALKDAIDLEVDFGDDDGMFDKYGGWRDVIDSALSKIKPLVDNSKSYPIDEDWLNENKDDDLDDKYIKEYII